MRTTIFSFIILSMTFLKAFSQQMTVYDLYNVQVTKDIQLIHNFLVNNKGFTYLSDYTDNSEVGWEKKVYLFSENNNIIEVNITTGIYQGKEMTITSPIYKINDITEYQYFLKSLIAFSFTKFKETTGTNSKTGESYTLTTWTNNTDIKTASVFDYGTHWEIHVLPIN